MKKLVNFLRGSVRVRAVGAFPERLLNLCAQNGVEFWAVDWRDECTVLFTVRLRGTERLYELGERIGCELTQLERSGFPEFARGFRERYAFLAGLVLALCAVALLSRFVLTVEVSGNERVPQEEILQQLQRFGVRPGAWAPGLDRRQIEQEILLALKDLSWMTINLHGTRVEVVVRETQPAPERIDESGFYHVVSQTDGMVVRVETEQGDPLVKEGDIVVKGDVLISGTVTMEPPLYSDYPTRYFDTHARGRVWCRTWRTLEGVIPLESGIKRYTGRTERVWALNFFGNRTEIFGNSSILDGAYDKITSVRQLCLSDGTRLPLWLVREEYREYEIESVPLRLESAQELLEQSLENRLAQLAGEDGEVLDVTCETRVSGRLIRVRAQGECLEEVGREVPAQAS